jgi:hypothetical protein
MEEKLYSKKVGSNDFQASNMNLEYTPEMIDDLKNFNVEKERDINVDKEQVIENIAWDIFVTKLGLRFTRELTPEEKKNFTDKPTFDYYREQAIKHYEKKQKALNNKKYPIIDVPASGKSTWMGDAYTLCFVYSKYNGNFVLRGYMKEVEAFLKKNHTHYFYNLSLWSNGFSRDIWGFWKDGFFIHKPDKKYSKYSGANYKWSVGRYTDSYLSDGENQIRKEKRLQFKRLPKRWIPEFDNL